jgi:hypothetical protein
MTRYIGDLEGKLYGSGQSKIDTDHEQKKVKELRSIVDQNLKFD